MAHKISVTVSESGLDDVCHKDSGFVLIFLGSILIRDSFGCTKASFYWYYPPSSKVFQTTLCVVFLYFYASMSRNHISEIAQHLPLVLKCSRCFPAETSPLFHISGFHLEIVCHSVSHIIAGMIQHTSTPAIVRSHTRHMSSAMLRGRSGSLKSLLEMRVSRLCELRVTASVEVLRSQVPIRAATESEPDRPVGAPPCHRQGSRQIPRTEFSQRERRGVGGGEGCRASTQETRLSLYATCGSHVRAPLLREGCLRHAKRRCFPGASSGCRAAVENHQWLTRGHGTAG